MYVVENSKRRRKVLGERLMSRDESNGRADDAILRDEDAQKSNSTLTYVLTCVDSSCKTMIRIG